MNCVARIIFITEHRVRNNINSPTTEKEMHVTRSTWRFTHNCFTYDKWNTTHQWYWRECALLQCSAKGVSQG